VENVMGHDLDCSHVEKLDGTERTTSRWISEIQGMSAEGECIYLRIMSNGGLGASDVESLDFSLGTRQLNSFSEE
jgi:hypothetical protein